MSGDGTGVVQSSTDLDFSQELFRPPVEPTRRDEWIAPIALSGRQFEKIIERGAEMAVRAGRGEFGRQFSASPSHVPVESAPDRRDTYVLGIDVGGEHTKVVVRYIDSAGETEFQVLFDVPNEDLMAECAGLGIERMAVGLASLAGQHLERVGIAPGKISGVGEVWSNHVDSVVLNEADICGVTGLTTGVTGGYSYRKGEPWNYDIRDGIDIGGVTLPALAEEGIVPNSFVVSNDTICTAKGRLGADGGVVASTGGNGTIIPAGFDTFCNGEMGGGFIMPSGSVTRPDFVLGRPPHFEDMFCGMGWDPRFAQHIIHAGERGLEELAPVADFLRGRPGGHVGAYGGRDLTMLLKGENQAFLDRHANNSVYTPAALDHMNNIASLLAHRGGILAMALGYFTVYNQIVAGQKRELNIAFDSSQARLLPGYEVSMRRTAKLLEQQSNVTLNVHLLRPQGKVSVPLIGACRAANDFLET